MLLKISLGLAILVGLATLYVSHFQVGGKINDLTEQLTTTKTTLEQTQQSEAKFKKESKDLRGQLDSTAKELGAATNELMAAQANAQEQRQRADKASTELTSVTAERNAAQEELNRWHL
ncbi:MAG TPA: hypothetical protein VGR78_00095, partial [Verrucomicrobiae bacterium]|nr:hypothetical protein [Verrucomicrobiae bacterium]